MEAVPDLDWTEEHQARRLKLLGESTRALKREREEAEEEDLP